MERVVAIGAMAISDCPVDILKTYALASCVAVTIHHPRQAVSGMIHIALPTPPDAAAALQRPCYYATTGLAMIMKRIAGRYGCPLHECRIGIYGGADSIRAYDQFRIGPQNIEVVRQILQKHRLYAAVEETAGTCSRTLFMEVGTGVVKILTQPMVI